MGTKKSSAWDYAIQPINTMPRYNPDYDYVCSHPRCSQKAEYLASYKYITGAKGNVSRAKRPLCKEHAHQFAIKHRLLTTV